MKQGSVTGFVDRGNVTVEATRRSSAASTGRGAELRELAHVDAAIEAVDCCAPLASPSMTDEEADATAALFRALADPARVRIVNVLATAGEPVCACDLYDPVGLAQPTVSHHLKTLVDAGLLERVQRGKWAFFSLNQNAVGKLAAVADLKGACC